MLLFTRVSHVLHIVHVGSWKLNSIVVGFIPLCLYVGYVFLFIIRNTFCFFQVQVDAVVYLVDAFDKERFAESKKELDALLSDEALANVPFLILGNKIDIPYAASEEELRFHLGLANCTTGKGKVNLAGTNVRPLEVFMCSIVRKMGYGDGFKWVSQYIN